MKERKEMRLAETGLGRLGAFAQNFSRKKMTKRITAGVLALSMVFTSVGIDAWAVSESDAGTYVNSENFGPIPEYEEIQQGENSITVVGPEEEVSYEDGLCIHHPTHTEGCGYDPGSPCEYEEAYGPDIEGGSFEIDVETVTEDDESEPDDLTEVPADVPTKAPTETSAADQAEAPEKAPEAESTEAPAETQEEAPLETQEEAPAETQEKEPTEAPEEESAETETEASKVVIADEPVAMGRFDEGSGISTISAEAPASKTKEETPEPEAKEETPAPEAKEEAPEPEVKKETPAPETKEETPAPEAKDETPATKPTAPSTIEDDEDDDLLFEDEDDDFFFEDEEPEDHVHDEECGYRPAHKCEFVCPICSKEEVFSDGVDNAVEFDFPEGLENGVVYEGQEISLLDGVTAKKEVAADDDGPSFDGMATSIEYDVEVFTVASDVSEPEEWNQETDTLTPQEGTLYYVVYVAMDKTTNRMVSAISQTLNTEEELYIDKKVKLISKFGESSEGEDIHVYAGNTYPVNKYIESDPEEITVDGEPYKVYIRVASVVRQDGEEAEGFFEETDEGTVLTPTDEHIQHAPYTITFVPYINKDGKSIDLKDCELVLANVDVLSQNAIRDELDSDSAFISDVGMGGDLDNKSENGIIDGTKTNDENDDPGNDSSPNNLKVRTFDTVTYKVSYKTQRMEDAYDSGWKQGRVYFEYFIPGVDKTQIQIEKGSMPWLTDKDTESNIDNIEWFAGGDDGHPKGAVLRGSFLIKAEGDESVIGASEYNSSLVIRVLNMKNGQSIQPEFTFWLAHNDVGVDYDKDNDGIIDRDTPLVCRVGKPCEEHSSDGVSFVEYRTVKADAVTVSAKLALNVQITGGTSQNNQAFGKFDFSTDTNNTGFKSDYKGDTVSGRLNGFGIVLQLKNEDTSKGLKGIQLPDEGQDITFDIKLSGEYEQTDGKIKKTSDADYPCNPQLWAADELKILTTGTARGTLPAAVTTKRVDAAPWNKNSYDSTRAWRTCNDGGTWTFEQDSKDPLTIHVTVSDYKIDLQKLPNTNSGTGESTTNTYYNPTNIDKNYWDIGTACISAGQVWVLQPLVAVAYKDNEGKEIQEGTDMAVFLKSNVNIKTYVSHDPRTVYVVNETGEKTKCGDTLDSDTDDKREHAHALQQPGTIDSYIFYSDSAWTNCDGQMNPLTPGQQNGNGDFATIGGKIGIHHVYNFFVGGEGDNTGVATDAMIKWDDRFFDPEKIYVDDNNYEYGYTTHNDDNKYHSVKVYWGTYAVHSDQTGQFKGSWHTSEDDLDPAGANYDDTMRDAMPEDMIWYSDLAQLKKDGYVCNAALIEYRGLRTKTNTFDQIVKGRIKDTAKSGGVYMVCDAVYAWRKSSVAAGALEYAKTVLSKNYASVNELTDEDYNRYLTGSEAEAFHSWNKDALSRPEVDPSTGLPSNLPKIDWMAANDINSHLSSYNSLVTGGNAKNKNNNEVASYKKAEYKAGSYTANGPSYTGGDSCLVLGHTDKIDIKHGAAKEAIDSFNLDNNMRYVDVTVSPSIKAEQAVVSSTGGAGKVRNITVEITLPKGIHYVKNTGRIGGDFKADAPEDDIATQPGTVENASVVLLESWNEEDTFSTWTNSDYTWEIRYEGDETKLILTIAEVELTGAGEQTLDPIHFSCLIGNPQIAEQDVKDNDQFTIKASITDESILMDDKVLAADKDANADTGFVVIKQLGNRIYKKADQFVVEAGEPMSFTMSVQNTSESAGMTKFILDELPYNGPGSKSNFTGKLTVASFSAGSVNSSVLSKINFYYSTKEDLRGKVTSQYNLASGETQYNPENHREDDGWVPMEKLTTSTVDKTTGATLYDIKVPTEAELDGKEIIAIAAYGEIPKQTTLLMRVAVAVLESKPGETLLNAMSMDSQTAKTSNAYSYVVRREITGLTWFDENHNGKQDDGSDSMLPGVKVTLIDQKTSDQLGGESAYVITGKTDNVYDFQKKEKSSDSSLGQAGYKFINVPAGTYSIRFNSTKVSTIAVSEGDQNQIDLSEYIVAAQGKGSKAENSDAEGIYDEGNLLKYSEIKDVEMLSADEMMSQIYRMDHEDAGFHGVDIKISKAVEKDYFIPDDKVPGDKEYSFKAEWAENETGSNNAKFTTLPQTVTVKAGGESVITNLPVGKSVKITEVDGDIPGFEVDTAYRVDGGKYSYLGSATVTTPSHEDKDALVEVAFTNHYRAPQITIEKTQKKADEAGNGSKNLLTVTEDDQITYYLTVTNIGNATAENVVVTDVIPQTASRKKSDGTWEDDKDHPLTLAKDADGSYIVDTVYPEDGTDVKYTYNDATKTIIWELGNMESMQTIVVAFQVDVPDVAAETHWKNTGKVVYNNSPDGKNEQETPPVESQEFAPEITIVKKERVNGGASVESASVVNDDMVTYVLTVKNVGQETAKDVYVRDNWTEAAKPISPENSDKLLKLMTMTISDGGKQDDDYIVWSLGDMEPGQEKEVSFTAVVPDVAEETHWKNVGAVTYENNPSKPVDPWEPSNEVEISELAPHISIVKEQSVNNGARSSALEDPDDVDGGYEVTYYLTVTSDGTEPATDVVVTDTIPQTAMVLKSSSYEAGGPTFTTDEWTSEPIALTLKKDTNGRYEISDLGEYDEETKTITWHLGDMDSEIGVSREKVVSFTVIVPDTKDKTVWDNAGAVQYSNNPAGSDDVIPSNHVRIEEEDVDLVPEKEHKIGEYEEGEDEAGRNKDSQIVVDGDKITYYITVKNNGKSEAQNVHIYDPLPTGTPELTLVKDSISDDGVYDEVKKAITWIIDSIPAEGEKTVHFTVEVEDTALEESTWTNRAYIFHDPQVDPDDPDPDDPNDPWEPTNEVEDKEYRPKIEIVKSQSSKWFDRTEDADVKRVYGGDTVTYYLKVTNSGKEAATMVTVSDTVPQTATVTRVSESMDGKTFVTKSDEPIALTLVDGSVTAERLYEAEGSFVWGSSYNDDTHEITWTFGEIPAGGTVEVSFQVTVPELIGIYEWKNVGKVKYDNNPDKPADPWIPSNDVHIEERTPEVKQEKFHSVNGGSRTKEVVTVMDGDLVTYYIKVTNTSDAKAENVLVYDAMPTVDPANGPKLTVAQDEDGNDMISDGGKLREDGSAIDWTIPQIAAHSSKTVEFTVVVPDVGEKTTWTNIAYVHVPHDPEEPKPEDPNPEDPDDPWNPTNEVEEQEFNPVLTLMKEQSSTRHERTRNAFSVTGGDIVTYYLTVTNSGEETAEKVVVKDQIPQKTIQGDNLPLALVEGSITEGGRLQSDRITIVWELGDIVAGQSKTVSFQVVVPYAPGTKNWKNVATTWYENPPADPENPEKPPEGSKENPTPSNEVEIYKTPPSGNPGNPGGGPGDNPGDNPGTEIPDNPTPLAEFPNNPVPLARFETIEDEDVPLAFLSPMTGDNKPVGAAALFGLVALGMMAAFGILGFKKKDEEDA